MTDHTITDLEYDAEWRQELDELQQQQQEHGQQQQQQLELKTKKLL
jgi:hypothetical protein